MLYSSAGLLAVIINLIINHDVLWNSSRRELPSLRSYRCFLLAITAYFLTDIAWGLLYDAGLIALTYADTTLYFLSMAFSILFWTQYVIDYLKEGNAFGKILSIAGWVMFAYQLIVIAVNFVHPILFRFDENGVYHAEIARYMILVVQVVMFLATAVFALFSKKDGAMRLRHRTIGMASLIMAAFILLQVRLPLLPMYSIGCLLSACVLHTFVLENEKEEYRDNLEERLQDSILKGNYYDLLTGLPGMIYFYEDVGKRRTAVLQNGGKPAFLYMNLSGLKFYNQEHGFAEGDRLLRTFTGHLLSLFGSGNCSRFGQDHFGVFTEEKGLEDRLQELLGKWSKDLPAIHLGVYIDELDGAGIAAVYDRAKLACDQLRGDHVSAVQYYDSAMFANAERHQYITSHLDQALAEQWIQVYYQPIVRAINGRVCDEEALARWIDPKRGFLSPADFIPILEEAKLIYKLDLYVLDQVLLKLHRQQDAGLYLVPQSINLSRSDFDMCDMVEEIRRRVDDAGIPRRLITIEITESIIGSDFDFIKIQVERFRSLGFAVWMDDFGSGYSSLDLLQSMPVDLIKLDMRFMQQFSQDGKSRIILTELIKMAIGLDIDTVCEGVEHEEQAEFLRDIGCSRLQGYYFTRPLPMDEVLKRYETGTQIGFENPAEADYFGVLGKVNLYDFTMIAREESDSLQHYFNTVPMAIIEVCGSLTRFTRSNQAYRDFMERMFHKDLASLGAALQNPPAGLGRAFVDVLMQCCREKGPVVFDETMPDGACVHAFMRKIAYNPLKDTSAIAVAVLAVTDAPAK